MIERPTIDPSDEMTCLGHEEAVFSHGGALAPPIVQTSLFAQPDLATLSEALLDEQGRSVYTRGRNPTVRAVEDKLARLERTEDAKAFGSGMGAVAGVLGALLSAGEHLLFVGSIYGPTLQLAARLRRQGVDYDNVLGLGVEQIVDTIRPNTRLIWMESPGTMTFRTFDVAAVASAARERGIVAVLDNSWASPLFQKPATVGVDLVVHSATKYLGGHSDLVAGVVAGSRELVGRIFREGFLLQGAVLAPFDAFLLNRGLRTLPLRMRRHHESGLAVARWLSVQSRVRQVFHPGLVGASSPTLSGYSGLFSIELDTEQVSDVRRFVDSLRSFRIGVSWGGVESLVIAPFRGDNAAQLERQGIPRGTVRLSIGLEPAELLIEDLAGALGTLR